jgi:hypothetical protein
MNDYHLPALWHTSKPAMLEIHAQALATSAQKVLSTEQVWPQACALRGGGFLVMPRRWHALHCLLHHQISDRGYVMRMLAIKALWEWTLLAQSFTENDWNAVATIMDTASAADVLGSWLIQANLLFGVAIPSSISISHAARAQAEATLRLASAPHLFRRPDSSLTSFGCHLRASRWQPDSAFRRTRSP